MKSFLTNLLTRKKLIIGFLVLIILGFSGYFLFGRSNGETLQFQEVKSSDIRSTTSASGILTGKTTVNLRFQTSGKLSFVNVGTGEEVTKGQTIAGLDTQDLNITLQQARNNLRQAEASVEKVHDDVKDNDDDESFAQKEARTIAEVAKDNAFDGVKSAQRAFQDAVISTPITGIITQVAGEPGQNISPSDVIAQVVDNSEIFFDIDLDEADLGKISLGKSAIITLDAFPDQEFQGSITQILPATELNSSNATVIPVRISLSNLNFPFVHGLNGQATIILQEKTNVLTIPLDSLINDDTVLVKTDTGVREQKIETGISSDTDIEVISGLKEGDQIVTNPSAYEKS